MAQKDWISDLGRKHIKFVLKLFSKGGVMPASPFGKADNYEDYSGIVFPEGTTIKKVVFQNINFTGAKIINSWIERCRFSRVDFSKTDLSEMAEHGNYFEDCLFYKVSFRNAVIGYEGSQFINCKFIESNFKGTGFIRTNFKGCEFINCNLRLVDFNASSFEDCSFIGLLDETWFRGGYKYESYVKDFGTPKKNLMKNISFENAELRDTIFSDDCNLENVKLPIIGKYKKINKWKRFIENLRKYLIRLSEEEKKELNIFIEVHLNHADGQKENILNYEDINKSHGKKIADLIWSVIEKNDW